MIVNIDQYYNNQLLNIGNNLFEQIFDINNNIEILPKQVEELIESFTKEYKSQAIFNESYIYTYLNESQQKINYDQGFQKLGIRGGASKVKRAGSDIAQVIKKNGITKESRRKIHNIISDLFEEIADNMSYNKKYDKDGNLKKIPIDKLKRSVMLLIWVLIISSLAVTVISILFAAAPMVAQIINTAIIAPIVEESAKIISVKGHFEKEFFIVFNTFEFSQYMILGGLGSIAWKMLGLDAGIINILRTRIAAVGMHAVNTVIHTIFNSDKFKEKFKLDDKDAKDKATLVSFIIGLLIHGTWNAAALRNRGFVDFIAGAHVPTEDDIKAAMLKKVGETISNI